MTGIASHVLQRAGLSVVGQLGELGDAERENISENSLAADRYLMPTAERRNDAKAFRQRPRSCSPPTSGRTTKGSTHEFAALARGKRGSTALSRTPSRHHGGRTGAVTRSRRALAIGCPIPGQLMVGEEGPSSGRPQRRSVPGSSRGPAGRSRIRGSRSGWL